MSLRPFFCVIFSAALIASVGCTGSTEVEVIEQPVQSQQEVDDYEASMNDSDPTDKSQR